MSNSTLFRTFNYNIILIQKLNSQSIQFRYRNSDKIREMYCEESFFFNLQGTRNTLFYYVNQSPSRDIFVSDLARSQCRRVVHQTLALNQTFLQTSWYSHNFVTKCRCVFQIAKDILSQNVVLLICSDV